MKFPPVTTFVTRPFLPPLVEFIPYLEKIWRSGVLTNGGTFHQEFERALCEFLGVKHVVLFTNATIALLTALQSLRLTGEVITTPYSFVATSHSLMWNGVKPVFVDIDENTLNIDPNRIQAAITPQTTGILAVHCYGRPCDVDAIQSIADMNNLKVVYDAAHAFGVECHCGSVLNHGDLSVISFHATKVFNTFEGGAIVCPDEKTKLRLDQLKNFGHAGETNVVATGINGKMSEFSAALGLLQLKYVRQAIQERSVVDRYYRKLLEPVTGIRCTGSSGEASPNYSYFPVLVTPRYPISRDELYERLRTHGVHARRYFFPLISEFEMYKGFASSSRENLTVATRVASEILCLPIYPGLASETVEDICKFISLQRP